MALTKIRGSQIQDYSIGNAHIDTTSPIVYSNLDLSNSIVATDLSTNHTVHTDVLDYKLVALWDMVQNLYVDATTGSNVTAQVSAAALTDTATMDGSAKGVLTTGTGANGVGIENYKVQIRDAITKDPISDGLGGSVYGQLVYSSGDYVLSYFKSNNTAFTMNLKDTTIVTTKANVSGSLFGKYFIFYDNNGAKCAFVFKEEGSSTAYTLPETYTTLVEVFITSNASANDVATAIKTATDLAFVGYDISLVNDTVTLRSNYIYKHTVDGIGTYESGFAFSISQYGTPYAIDFMFEEIYSLNTAPLKGFVTGVGFTDIISTTGSHNHNDLYYSKSELEAGQLDDRYFTEAELSAGQLDSRYYTESELTGGALDGRYYTESELGSTASGSSGASRIGISGITGVEAGTVQGAIAELQGDLDNIVSGGLDITHSLDDAYNDGAVVTVDGENVDFELSTGKTFKIADATNTSKFVVSQGAGTDSVKINTAGGVDVDAATITIDGVLTQTGSTTITGATEINGTLNAHGASAIINTTGNTTITSTAGDVAISGTNLTLKDANLTAAMAVSETGVSALSANITATSIVGAINENADELNTLIVTTLPATTDGAAGADKVGVTGITGVIPTGGTLGSDGTVQSMLEGVALSASGGKVFADELAFTTAKSTGTYFKQDEIVFILSSNRQIRVLTQGVSAAEGINWIYVAGVDSEIGGAFYNINSNVVNVTSQEINLDAVTAINLDTPNIVGTGDLTLTTESWISAGNIKITSVDPTDQATISGSRNGTANPLNKLVNSGFELGSGITANNWTLATGVERTQINRFYGSYAAKVNYNQTSETPYTLFTQNVAGLTANTAHVISFYVLGTVGNLAVQLNGGAVKIITGATYTSWTRVNIALDADNTASGSLVISAAASSGNNNFYIDAIMVVEGASALDYFTSYQSELAFTIGDEDDDRIVFRSAGTTAKDLVRINQSTVEILGNLLVSGTTTTVNSEDLLVADNQIVLNSNVTGTPSLDAFFKVKRGTSSDAAIRWNESTDKWELTADGTTYNQIVTAGGDSSGLSLDAAYRGGSEVTVDSANITFTLNAGKQFQIADADDTSKFAVVGGNSVNSVFVNTSGGIGLLAARGITFTNSHVGFESQVNFDETGNFIIIDHTGAVLTVNEGLSYVSTTGNFSSNTIDATVTASGNIGLTAIGNVTVSGAALALNGTAASNLTVTGANLSMGTVTSGNVGITSAGELTLGDSRNSNIKLTDATYFTLPNSATSIVGAINMAYTAALNNANTLNEVYQAEPGVDRVVAAVDGSVKWNLTDTYKFEVNDSAGVGIVSVAANVSGDTVQVNGNITASGKTHSISATGTGASVTISSEDTATIASTGALGITGNGVTISGNTASITGGNSLTLVSTTGNITNTAGGEISLTDSRTTATLSDATHHVLPESSTSIVGAIAAAYNHVGKTVERAYQEVIATSTDVTNDYIVSNITLLPNTGTLSPSALRALTDSVHAVLYLNGLRLSDTEWSFAYDATSSERRIMFNGSNNITLVTGDIIMIDVERISTPAVFNAAP